MSRKPLIILGAILAGIILIPALFIWITGSGFKNSGEAANFKPVTLEYWGVTEQPEDIAVLTQAYNKRHPKIGIHYTKYNEADYKQKIVEAWALGQGPDLFMIPNTKIREYLRFLVPMPKTMKAPVQELQGTIKKEIVTKMVTYTGLTTKQLQDKFLDVVGEDVIIGGRIYALPYSVDTLSVFYNKDLLKSNNIPLPAKNWKELIDQASTISKIDANDKIVQSTIALGTTNNIPSVFDIISTLLLQTGVVIGDGSGIRFQTDPKTLDAIQFFLSFARPGLQNYSWSKESPDALDAFTSGKLAYFIGYSYEADQIRKVNPRLNFDMLPMFAPEGSENTPSYSSYWVTVVSKPHKTANSAELAWQYLNEVATNPKYVKDFLYNQPTGRTTALKEMVKDQMQDQILGPFANHLLQTKSWYRGYNFTQAQKYFLEMVEKIGEAYMNDLDPRAPLLAGADLISQTYSAPR